MKRIAGDSRRGGDCQRMRMAIVFTPITCFAWRSHAKASRGVLTKKHKLQSKASLHDEFLGMYFRGSEYINVYFCVLNAKV
jgi:hypothetical protein